MPLKSGVSRAAIAQSIATDKEAGKPRKQAIAIALNMVKKAKQS